MRQFKSRNTNVHGPTADAAIVSSQHKSILCELHICYIGCHGRIDLPARLGTRFYRAHVGIDQLFPCFSVLNSILLSTQSSSSHGPCVAALLR